MKKYFSAFPYFPEEDIEKILQEFREILNGKNMLTMGINVAKFEQEFAEYCGTKYAVVTNSCTAALEIVLQTLNLNKNDEVVVPAQTFIASGSCVLKSGAKVVFCDTDKNFLINYLDLKKKITKKTKAVIVVHYAGLISNNIFKIKKLLHDNNICMIEDAAHAHGAMVNNIKAGSIGDFGCFSFYSTKIMTSGEGGMITMNNESSYKKCSSYRNRGIDVDNKNGELFINLGSNHRMTEFQAILCRSQLSRLPEFLSHRNQIANAYIKILSADGNHFRFQEYDETTYHSYWRFIVFLDKKIDRQKVQLEMSKKNIVIDAPYSPLLHKQPIFESSIDLPCVESYSSHHVSLPIHSLISIKDATYIAKNLLELIK